MILLDTSACSYLIRGESRRLEAKLRELHPRDVCISAVTRAELMYGLARNPKASRLQESVSQLFERVRSLAWPNDAAGHFAWIGAKLAAAGNIIGPLDLMIAAHARSLGVPLVTGNLREFSRVPDLELLDWLRDS